jgi:hypothetical protein
VWRVGSDLEVSVGLGQRDIGFHSDQEALYNFAAISRFVLVLNWTKLDQDLKPRYCRGSS